jgi:hypothetical protein
LSNRFAGVKRGRALRGSSSIAAYVLDDPQAGEIVLSLPRDEFGLIVLGRELTGFSGWIDFALTERARRAKSRSRTTARGAAREVETAEA